MTTIAEARDEMIAIVRTALLADTPSLDIRWEDIPQRQAPVADAPWARITVRHATGRQTTLGNRRAGRRFERRGTLWVEIYTPSGQGLSTADDLYMVALNALEGRETPSGIWFSNVRLTESGLDGAWFKGIVRADFLYDEVK